MKKTGFIAIVGRPNVGKSTLLNRILGRKVSIVSSKPQTTRNNIAGIYTEGESQYVFYDTPGIHKPKDRLGDFMVGAAHGAMAETDAVILVADAGREISDAERDIAGRLKNAGCGSILALNKIDMYGKEKIAETISKYAELFPFDAFVPISAKTGKNVGILMEETSKFLTDSFWYFPEGTVTDQPERQIASEVIREKILRNLDKEVPHGVAVVIEDLGEKGGLLEIRAEIFCEKESHKKIIIGKNGSVLKTIGSQARENLEKIFGSKIYLDLWVKVKERWRESEQTVANFGYKLD